MFFFLRMFSCLEVVSALCCHLQCLFFAGQLVWQRHLNLPPPSHHVLRATCMQLLPLVEMYCRWELEEDCSNLRGLMLRFDSESGLESHSLGCSLLSMIRDDGIDFDTLPPRMPIVAQLNPFDTVRQRLATTALAIRDLHTQVYLVLASPPSRVLPNICVLTFRVAVALFATLCIHWVCNSYISAALWLPFQMFIQLQCQIICALGFT